MPLRVNVAATASLIVSPSKVLVSARRSMSKKVLHPPVRQRETHHRLGLLGD
jgi:hypothetical protein